MTQQNFNEWYTKKQQQYNNPSNGTVSSTNNINFDKWYESKQQQYSAQALDKRISEAEEKVKNAEEYAQRINSRFAWIGDKGRERAGLKPLGADYEGPTNYKQGLAEAKAELTAAKDEKWWAEAANDLTGIYSQTDNSSTYTDNQQKANEVLDKMSDSVIGDFWHINDDELATLMTLREEDPELADRYYEILEYALNERKAEAQAEDISNRSTIGKIGTYLGAGFSAPGSLLDTIGSAIREGITGEYKPADLNSDAYWGSRTRAQISDELLSGIDSPFVRFLAETGLSAADYLTKLPFGGPAALGIMSATSAGETAYDALARGASAADAAWSGIANGAVTALTEKLPLDNLFRIARSGAGFLTRNGIKNVLQQSGIEATEELVSSYLNTLTDIAINGDKSNYNLTVENYMQNGMSREEAEKQANEDFFILDPLRSAAGGALSGFAFGSGGTMLGNIRNRYNRANVDNNNYPYDTSRGDLNDVENINNKEEGPQVSDAEAPNDTPEAAHALLSSNLNIPQNSEKINSDQGQNLPPTDSFRTPEGEGEAVANQFAENSLQKAAEAGTVNKKIADALEGSTHQRVSNQQLIEQAQKAITDNDPDPVAQYLRDKVNRGNGLNSVETTAGLMLIEDYSRQGNVQAATDLADTMMQASSDGARALQALKLIQKNLPGSFITLANKTLARKGLPMLNETEVNTINALQTLANEADNIMTIENAEQRQAAIDEIVANVDPQYQKYINKLFKGKNKEDLSDWFLLLTQKVVSDKTPATLTDKIRSWQRINLLLNPKTNIRNVLGNTLFSTAELLGNTTVAPWIDRLLSLRTGQRTATLPQMNEYFRGMAQGARDTVTAAQTGTLSMLGNRYSDAPNSATRPFKNKILSGLDNATTAALTFGDKIFSGAREADVAAQLRKINPNLSDAEIAEIAHQLALEITFQDDSGMAKFLLKIRNAISGEGKRNTSQQGENTPQKIGNRTREAISYATLPFAKTPANILNQVMNYSPLGLANGITKAVRVATQGKNASPTLQRQAVDAISRGLVGSGLMGIGTLLASLGLASGGSSEEDKRYREANGISDNSIKFSIGDKDYWIDFSSLGPVPTAINTGATIWNELQKITDGGTAFDIVKQLFTAPVNDITQDDLWSGIIDLVGYLGEGDTERALEEVLGDAVTQAVPLGSFLRMITGTIDPYTRETSGETEADWTLNRIVSQLPGASNTLPIKYDALGEPVKRYTAADNLGERLLWSSIMPGNASLDRSDNPVIQETNKIYASTGDTSVLPQNAPYSIQYGGETHQVVGQNRSDYAKTAGQFASQSILDVLDSPTYINASDEEKADILSAIIGVGKEDARRDYFGTEGIPYDATTTASNQLDFVNNMERYGLTSGDAVALYKGVRNEDTTSNAAKAKAILDSGLTGVQKIAAANELFKDSSDTFISNLSEAIMRGIADEWVQLYGLVQDKENNEYAYSEEFINTYFDLLTQGMSPSNKQWIQSTLRRWRMIPQEIF